MPSVGGASVTRKLIALSGAFNGDWSALAAGTGPVVVRRRDQTFRARVVPSLALGGPTPLAQLRGWSKVVPCGCAGDSKSVRHAGCVGDYDSG